MRGALAVLVLAAIGAAAWYFLMPAPEPEPSSAPTPPSTAQAPRQSAPAETTEPAVAKPVTADDPPEAIQREAERFVETLTEPVRTPVEVEKADHFVSQEQMLSLLPEASIEETSAADMKADVDLADTAPITVVKEVEQIEFVTPERVIAESGGNLETPVKVLIDDEVKIQSVREILEAFTLEPDRPIAVVKLVKYFEITTPGELMADENVDPDALLKVIKRPYRLEAASISDLIKREREIEPDSVFYVRTVRPTDGQGIWGIVQDGLIENFARGMAVRRGEEISRYQVDIPRDADERRSDSSSSFLGKLIYRKTIESYVYNFKENRMGQNPDRIRPGQEIVIIKFHPDELAEIYRHFIEERG